MSLTRLIPSQLRGRHREGSSRPPVPLPVEIVERIFRNCVPPNFSASIVPPFRYAGYDMVSKSEDWGVAFDWDRHVTAHMKATRKWYSTVISFVLVCRLWYLVGIKFLYANAILFSQKQTRLLNSTMANHPEMIRHFHLFYNPGHVDEPDDLTSLLQKCGPSIETLVVVHCLHDVRQHHASIMRVGFFTHLRTLILYGGLNYDSLLRMDFPLLEHLRLQKFSSSSSNLLLGKFPRLLILQLIEVKMPLKVRFFTHLGRLPRLRTLEIYMANNEFLQLWSTETMQYLRNIQHLLIGIVDGDASVNFGFTDFPPNLINFTLLVNLSLRKCNHPRHRRNESKYTMQRLYPITSSLRSCNSLRNFVLVTQADFFKLRSLDSQEIVHNACEDLNLFLNHFRRSEKTQTAAGGYVAFLSYVREKLTERNVATHAVWCDLATFINYRLERPFDQLPVHPSSGIPCETIGIMSQSIVYNIGGNEREFDQSLLAPIL